MSVIVNLLSKFDNSGIKTAKHQFSGLKTFIGGLGLGIGLSQVTSVLVDSAKAAGTDAKSMALLHTQLTRNTKATKSQITQNDRFIDTLSNQVGIVDDDLRPAMGKLVRATGSVTTAQDLLQLSLDASATSGKPLAAVSTAMAKAFTGSTTALVKMFPELKGTKDMFGKLRTEVEGAAVQQATPFDKFNVAMDNLKEKLGAVILPLISDFIDQMMKPGGAIDQVGQFLEDLTNPKTDAGKMFTDIKDAVNIAFTDVKNFFALFGNGDAMKGFGNIAKALVSALPALIALKGIMFLSQTGKSLVNLVAAIAALRGGGGGGTGILPGAAAGAGKGVFSKLIGVPVVGTVAAVLTMSGDSIVQAPRDLTGINPKTGAPYNLPHLFGQPAQNPLTTNNVTINVQSADPKAVVDALGKYVKGNGKLPPALFPGVKP
jgi:hypothetical protein